MSFVLRMAAREARASWRRLLLFFLALAVGVGAIVSVRSLVGGVRGTLGREARSLLGGDVLVQTNRPLDDAQRATIEKHLTAPVLGGAVRARTQVTSTSTMARPADSDDAPVRLVEVRGVDAAFPLYGTVELADGQPYSHALLQDRGALVAPELQAQLGLEVGERLVLGSETFTVRGVVLKEPGRRPSVFSLGPRVVIDLEALHASGLLGYGSRALYQLLLRVDERAVEPLERTLMADFADQYVSVHTYRGARGRADEGLQRAEGYLSLVGFAILVLGGVGVASVVRVFVQERLKSLAVLKCLGASGRQVLAVDLLQVLLLGLAGSLFGLVLARAALAAVPRESAEGLGVASLSLTPVAVAQGVGVGLAVALLFSLPPLLDARRVKPLLLLRHETTPPAGARRDPGKLAAVAFLAAGVVALAAWQAGSWRAGLLASGGFAAVVLLLHGAGLLLVKLAAALGRRARFPWRQALLRLGRPGNQTRPVLLAVGLGSFFILAVAALQAQLLAQFAVELRADAPDLFLIDVQPAQAAAVERRLEEASGHPARLVPVLRLRVTAVRGQDVQLDSFAEVRGRGALAREYMVTWRDALDANERVIEGRFWEPGELPAGALPEVSIEKSLHRRFGIRVGDELRFDVLGRSVSARVTSVREVNWSDARSGGFMFLFRPGSLRGTPATYVAFAQGPKAAAARAGLQRDLAVAFPNVSVIDLRDVLQALQGVVSQIARAVSAVGAVTLVSGVLILLGAVAVTRRQRRYETAVLRTLGARTRGIVTLLAAEYAVLGALAGLVGALGATVFSAVATRELLDVPWTPTIGTSLLGVAVTAAGVGLVGLLASADVVRRKPLGVLRAE